MYNTYPKDGRVACRDLKRVRHGTDSGGLVGQCEKCVDG